MGFQVDVDPERLTGRLERRQIAIDARLRAIRRGHFCQRTDGNLRAYATRVAHGNANDGAHVSLRPAALSQPGARRTYLIARR
ncbi:hypothetical protein D3C72_2062260 [compost metagenome]